jgi:hypothetical protein
MHIMEYAALQKNRQRLLKLFHEIAESTTFDADST